MPIMFNTLLEAEGFRLADVRLLRHKDNRAAKGRSPYDLWRDDRPRFNSYQATQSIGNQAKLESLFWAVFVGTPNDETLFVGMHAISNRRLLDVDSPMPHMDGVDTAGSCNVYDLALEERMSDLIGKLVIDWGPGERAWIQRADQQNKRVSELRTGFKEPAFPGFTRFIEPLSRIEGLPSSWAAVLGSIRGVYLLTCPRTREQYVGSATGEDGFLARWLAYVRTGHGGDVALKSRDPSDYQVSILEVAGSSLGVDEILALETLWKQKLQSRDMGLNRN
ncbi:MAG: GIY-YIG nuclease family protein [Gemmataceae bacterium]|nr:GIY-YIG nuclease family protein [Gemmataceae bacterium]